MLLGSLLPSTIWRSKSQRSFCKRYKSTAVFRALRLCCVTFLSLCCLESSAWYQRGSHVRILSKIWIIRDKNQCKKCNHRVPVK